MTNYPTTVREAVTKYGDSWALMLEEGIFRESHMIEWRKVRTPEFKEFSIMCVNNHLSDRIYLPVMLGNEND